MAVTLTRTVTVSAGNSWELVVATQRCMNDLPKKLDTKIMEAIWNIQDGYGEPGFMPGQGWDWSGIRDSSELAQLEMGREVVRRLTAAGITQVQYEA